MARSWEERHEVARATFVPWLGETIELGGARVVDFGGGSGSFALAIAPFVDHVLCLDESPTAIEECASRARAGAIDNVEARSGSFPQLLGAVEDHDRPIDVFVLFAVLEHMTLEERLTTLQLAARSVSPDGAIVVVESPNRLLWNDYHTTETPFFGVLPDDLVLQLAHSMRRAEFGSRLADESAPLDARRQQLARMGRGVSHHELEAVFGTDVHRHILATGWDPALTADRAVYPDELYLARFLAAQQPHVAPCFSRYWLDFVLRPGSIAERSLPRPWPLHSLGSDRVASTPWESLRIEPGGTLRIELPEPAGAVAISIGSLASDDARLSIESASSIVVDVTTFDHPEHDRRQTIVRLPDPSKEVLVRATGAAADVASVLWWPASDGHQLGPLPILEQRVTREQAPMPSPAPVPVVVSAADGLHGTYVGSDRVLVRLRGGGRLLVSSDDLSLMPELVAEGGYDAPFTAFLRRVLQPGSTFVDVGANVGLFTVIGALAAWRGRVIAYEPAPALERLLSDNVQLNWLNDRVDVRTLAVGDRPGRSAFRYDARLQILGGLSAAATDGLEVEVVTLDEDLAGVGPIDLVKIDVEGGEAGVLAGMRSSLHSGLVEAVSIELRRDAHDRLGRPAEWQRLVAELTDLALRSWTFALIAPDGTEIPRPLAEVLASEPHPNVVLRRPPSIEPAA